MPWQRGKDTGWHVGSPILDQFAEIIQLVSLRISCGKDKIKDIFIDLLISIDLIDHGAGP